MRRSIVCDAGRLASTFFRKIIVACIFRSGISTSAFTPLLPGCPGLAGTADHTTEPRLTAGFCGSPEVATNIAARAGAGAVCVAPAAAPACATDFAGGGACKGVESGAGVAPSVRAPGWRRPEAAPASGWRDWSGRPADALGDLRTVLRGRRRLGGLLDRKVLRLLAQKKGGDGDRSRPIPPRPPTLSMARGWGDAVRSALGALGRGGSISTRADADSRLAGSSGEPMRGALSGPAPRIRPGRDEGRARKIPRRLRIKPGRAGGASATKSLGRWPLRGCRGGGSARVRLRAERGRPGNHRRAARWREWRRGQRCSRRRRRSGRRQWPRRRRRRRGRGPCGCARLQGRRGSRDGADRRRRRGRRRSFEAGIATIRTRLRAARPRLRARFPRARYRFRAAAVSATAAARQAPCARVRRSRAAPGQGSACGKLAMARERSE